MEASDARHHRRVIALMALTKLILTADFAIVSLALPSIGRDLGVSPATLGWVVTANTLALAGTLIVGGKLVDRYGHRRALTVGLALFGLASLAAGLAPHFELVLAARVAHGLAVALLSPGAFALITAFLPDGPIRHRALGIFGITQGLSLIVGLLVGGWIVSTFGWRGAFFVNVPLVGIALSMTLAWLPRVATTRGEAIDGAGAITATVAMTLLVGGIALLGRIGVAPTTLAMLAGAGVTVAMFVAIERRVAAPLVPATLVRRPMFALSAFTLTLFMAAVGGLLVLSQLYMQRVLGFAPALAGLAAMPYALAVIAAGQLAPTLLARVTARRAVLGAGLLNLAGLTWLAMSMGQPYATSIAPGMVICALGSVTTFIVMMQAATAPLAPGEQGVGTALLFTAQQVGTGLGATVTMVLLDPGTKVLAADDFTIPFLALAGGIVVALAAVIFTRPAMVRDGQLKQT
ncbi:MFS transporter [Sphingomonas sp. TX0543]|uniref:MFS transporter n=1 Tax=Sphingomonas sp. TX0543 TaxID=3399682 RepID=UPI003AFA7974